MMHHLGTICTTQGEYLVAKSYAMVLIQSLCSFFDTSGKLGYCVFHWSDGYPHMQISCLPFCPELMGGLCSHIYGLAKRYWGR